MRKEVLLLRSLIASKESSPILLEIVGEPGSGRRRLIEEAASHLEQRGFQTIRLEGYRGRGSSQRTIPELARKLFAETGAADEPALLDDLRQSLRRSEIADSLLVETTEDWAAPPRFLEAAKEAVSDDKLALLLDAGENAERILWSYLGSIIDLPVKESISFIYSIDCATAAPAEIADRVHRIRLAPLTEAELMQILTASGVNPSSARLAAEHLYACWQRSPRAARLTAEVLVEARSFGEEEIRNLIGPGLRRIHRYRFERLDPAEQKLLQVASLTASGINFWRMKQLGMADREEVGALTDSLVQKGFLRKSYPGGKLRLIFADQEVRLIAYACMDPDERTLLHAQLARIVESDDIEPHLKHSEVGRHLLLAGDEISGAANLLDAGKEYLERGGIDEARKHFEEVAKRGSTHRALRTERLYALEGLGNIERHIGEAQRAKEAYKRTLEEGAELLGPADRVRLLVRRAGAELSTGEIAASSGTIEEAKNLLAGNMEQERILLNLLCSRLERQQGHLQAAIGTAHEALTQAIRLGRTDLIGRARLVIGKTLTDCGELHAAKDELEAAREIFQRNRDAAYYARVSNSLGIVVNSLGDHQEAIRCYSVAMVIAERLSMQDSMLATMNNLATIQSDIGNLEQAEQLYRRCLRLGKRTGNTHTETLAHANLASLCMTRGRYREAMTEIQDALRGSQDTIQRSAWLACKIMEGQILTALGQLADSGRIIADTLERCLRADNPELVCWVRLARSERLIVLGRLDEARDEMTGSLASAGEHGFKKAQFNSLLRLVEIELERGNVASARKCLESAKKLTKPDVPSHHRSCLRLSLAIQAREDRLSDDDVRRLEALAGESLPPSRYDIVAFLASQTEGSTALRFAREAFHIAEEMGHLDNIWRASYRLGRIESDAHIPEAAEHLELAARTVLKMAAELDDEEREIFLGSYGRRKVLTYASLRD